jgi:flavin reductase (DIM6/NTAB) family NADH-FMN oxidoreductase RutF
MRKHGSDSFTSAEFRLACSLFPTGVTVVTRLMPDRRPHGLTVSSFTSLSLHPPLVLVCIDLRSSFLKGLAEDDMFAINVLNEDQKHLSIHFSKPSEEERFQEVVWHEGERGVPLLSDAVATFQCQLSRTVDAGDHRILIGKVRRLEYRKLPPLVWYHGSYHPMARSVASG